MRIIPKETRVPMEFFKGVELLGVVIAAAGVTLTLFMLLSSLPLRWMAALTAFIVFSVSTIPLGDEKAYESLYYVIKYAVNYKEFVKHPEKKGQVPAAGVTSFTGISDVFIEYGTSCLGVVVEIPFIKFRFPTEPRQNQLIGQVYGSILRTVNNTDSAAMVKLDRPVLYDSFIGGKEKEMKGLRVAYIRGLMTDEELTVRIGIIQGRMNQLELFNNKETICLPFHYMVFFERGRRRLTEQAQDMVGTLGPRGTECRILEEQELAVFLKYDYSGVFGEWEAWKLTPDQYMDWILPGKLAITPRTIAYDGLVTHNLRVIDYPTVVPNTWGYALFSRPDARVTLKMRPIDRYRGVKQIDEAIDRL